MAYCPSCGARVNDHELFCVTCGGKLPQDLYERIGEKKRFSQVFKLPLISLVIVIVIAIGVGIFSYFQREQAQGYYENAEEAIWEGDYQLAFQFATDALNKHSQFPEAVILQQFSALAFSTLDDIEQTEGFQDKVQLIQQTQTELDLYQGEIATDFQELLRQQLSTIQLTSIQQKLDGQPDPEDLPAILWEAEGIQGPDGYEFVQTIRNQISAYTLSQANHLLQGNQFSEAKTLVENGLYYIPNDEKLQSLLANIKTEQASFQFDLETRMEQAFSAYEQEVEINQNQAIDLIDISFVETEQGHLTVSGELTSVATVPISTIQVHFHLLDHNDEILEDNQVFVHPDILYPGENGQFDFTYFDTDLYDAVSEVKMVSITWLVNE
ncbi:hypothetical protein SAMN04488134_101572 [Amphibacillus marinus]|uniref:Zinc-ribbon domain-containing protein n=1 Tax=Amphibacillus marinus TaxID=872970 RepID=A0A1H8IB69_9BACI|nr:FxLYD domain-containing protein [Amphibacillus marinus]SEN65684.1 hypothetical protein SAMN04488134_101572 [Amphibacillus marinus]